MTIRDALREAIPALHAARVDTPRLDAEVLLAALLGHDRGWVWSHPEAIVPDDALARFRAWITRRARREPLAYLLGEREFYGRVFTVTPAVLVPRPETELLVEAVLAWITEHPATYVADIGTGSGIIAVTLAIEAPSIRLAAVDISPEALRVARDNAHRYGVDARIIWLAGDLLTPLRGGDRPDVIVANLPYIATETYATLMPEVREYEPALALVAAQGGLAMIERLIAESPAVLRAGGLLALEVGFGQAQPVADRLAGQGWCEVRVIMDYGGIPRHVLAMRPPNG